MMLGGGMGGGGVGGAGDMMGGGGQMMGGAGGMMMMPNFMGEFLCSSREQQGAAGLAAKAFKHACSWQSPPACPSTASALILVQLQAWAAWAAWQAWTQ